MAILLKGVGERLLFPDTPSVFIWEGRRIEGEERFIEEVRKRYSDNVTIDVVRVTSMGSKSDEFLVLSVKVNEEEDEAPSQSIEGYFEYMKEGIEDIKQLLTDLTAVVKEALSNVNRGKGSNDSDQ